MKKTKEEIENYFEKINKIKARIKFLVGDFWWIKKITKWDLSKVFSMNENIWSTDDKWNNILVSSLQENKIPFDMLYHSFWPDKYFNITHSKTSKYSNMYTAETELLEELINKNPEYINKHIIDIWCWDWIKIFNMLKQWIKNKKIKWTVDYLWLDDSQDMLNFAPKDGPSTDSSREDYHPFWSSSSRLNWPNNKGNRNSKNVRAWI
jgi:hypothetical protein